MTAHQASLADSWYRGGSQKTGQTDDARIKDITVLPPPEHLIRFFPIRGTAVETLIGDTRRTIHNIMAGEDDRLLVIVGPCSIHDPAAAIEYARRLAPIREQYRDTLEIVMRVYFEKPRTTRLGLLTTPLRDRFGIPIRLNFYTVAELEFIVKRGARLMGLAITEEGANEIARRSRGTPRIAGRLLRRVRDFAIVAGKEAIDREIADRALLRLEVDRMGLDQLDRRYLDVIALSFGGGPVGIETIAAALSEPRDAIEEIVEPYLIQQGFVQRTPRGRMLTQAAFRHLGVEPPSGRPEQLGLGLEEE